MFPVLSEIQNNILLNITKRRDSPQHLAKRVKIVLLTAEAITDKDAALSRISMKCWQNLSVGHSREDH